MTLILNDLHVGFHRKGGTTPASSEALRSYLLKGMHGAIDDYVGHLLILGDLFDDFEVDGRDWVNVFLMLQLWMDRSPHNHLTLVAGNHDHSQRAGKVSSFEMLAVALQCEKMDLLGIDQSGPVAPNVWAIAHCSNQDVFNHHLEDAVFNSIPDGAVLLLHANYANGFAVESDHSLNVSEEQALAYCHRGIKLVFAHEHQSRSALPHGRKGDAGGEVIVLGNQWPTSVADCLGNDDKWAWTISDAGAVEKHVQTWSVIDERAPFARVDWRELDKAPDCGFIRIEGNATMVQAAEVVQAISKMRNKSDAFVIVNAVKVEGMPELDELPATFEAAKRFDVLAFIRSKLDPEESALLDTLL